MHSIPYLTQRRKIYFFRRRVPRLSTGLSPVMVSLGTTDRRSAYRLCMQLTARMDQMLDEKTHIFLPDADVAAFFKAELRRCVDELRRTRVIEHMDGSLTAERVSRHRLEAFVLRSLNEDGLRDQMPDERISQLSEEDREEAANIQHEMFKKFISPAFNNALQRRAVPDERVSNLSEFEKLQLRWKTVEANMAAHHALQNVPLHASEDACRSAEQILTTMMSIEPEDRKPNPSTEQRNLPSDPGITSHPLSPITPTSTTKLLTPGVDAIKGPINAEAIYRQRDQALAQPEDETFDGDAHDVVVEQVYGEDLFGTAVRLCRRQSSRDGTKDQKLKSVSLFIYVTGVQFVADIRTHHLEAFARALQNHLPKHYWKSAQHKRMTFKELMTLHRSSPDITVGLGSGTIERHLTTIKSITSYASREGNGVPFDVPISEMVPADNRTDAEKRSVFTYDDIRQVFAHPLWTGSKSRSRRHTSGDMVIKDHHFWINLILAHTGARRSEIAGLLVSDVLEEDGINHFYIRPNFLRGLKKPHCKRRIPLHPELISQGFLDFVAASASKKEIVLFPAAIPAKIRETCLDQHTPPPPYNDKFGDGLDHVWRECLVRSLKGNPEKYSLHSLRHYVNEAFAESRSSDGITKLVSAEDRRDIMGHNPIDVNERTYRRDERPLAPLYEIIKLLPNLLGD